MELPGSGATAAVLYFLALISPFSLFTPITALTGTDVEFYQVVNATPSVLDGPVVSKNVARCARINVTGLSRLKLWSYSSAHKITLLPSEKIQEASYSKIQIYLHKNSSLGLCQCEDGNWESIQSGIWTSIISPYEDRYIDVKFVDNLSGSVTVLVKSEFHRWRLISLVIGLVLLSLAPVVSSWVPFYYSSSMAIGICLVVIILLFQGMKLLPIGRKNALYSTIYGLALGAGSFLLSRLSMFVNSVLANFGVNEEIHHPVLIFLLVDVGLAGAAFGYWLVRKFVVEDGRVDVGVAQFVKWALRVIAVTFIFQSTLDNLLLVALLVSFMGFYISLTLLKWRGTGITMSESTTFWNSRRTNKIKCAEFLSCSANTTPKGGLWRNSNSPLTWSKSPAKVTSNSRGFWSGLKTSLLGSNSRVSGVVTPPSHRGPTNSGDYYSTFHKTPNRKKYSKDEWQDLTEKSTRQAVAELAASPEFADWVINNANRIRLCSDESSDESVGSGSDSTDENVAQSCSGHGLLWKRAGNNAVLTGIPR